MLLSEECSWPSHMLALWQNQEVGVRTRLVFGGVNHYDCCDGCWYAVRIIVIVRERVDA